MVYIALEELNRQYKSAKVSVWWDLENWDELYKDFDPRRIKENICSALVGMNYHGPVSIFCYVNATKIPQNVQTDLSLSGISIKHYSQDAKLGMLVCDMMYWADCNPLPANYLFISDDDRYTYAINTLKWNNYNILLALSPKARARSLVSNAKFVWLSTRLLSGESPASKEEVKQLWCSDSDR